MNSNNKQAIHAGAPVYISENLRGKQAPLDQRAMASLRAMHEANQAMARHIQAMKESLGAAEKPCEAAQKDSIPLVKPRYWVRILDAYGERKLPCEDVLDVYAAIGTRYKNNGLYEVTDGDGNKVSDL